MKNIKKYYIIAIVVILLLVSVVYIVQNNKNEKAISLNEDKIDMLKQEYESKKEQFTNMATLLENKISETMLDGTVVDDNSLEKKIESINKILKKENYSKFSVYENNPFRGEFYLNKNGKLRYKFYEDLLKPAWTKDEDVAHYFV